MSWIKSRKHWHTLTQIRSLSSLLINLSLLFLNRYSGNGQSNTAKINLLSCLGGLHIEMAALKSIDTLLQSSGWTSAIVEADIASSGTAESFCLHLVLLEHEKPTRSQQAVCIRS